MFRSIPLLSLTLVICTLMSSRAFAWSDHASLVWPLLRNMPEMLVPSVSAERLEDFVAAEANGLERVLAEHEAFARASWPHYAARPDALAFDAVQDGDLRGAFLRAIRVNPDLSLPLYRQTTVEDELPPGSPLLRFADFSFMQGGVSHETVTYLLLRPGQRVSPAHVLASGSDEPDFGLDIGLFEDNDSEHGKRYGFGSQSFGNPNLEFSSQAPFHMGFYHLDWLTEMAQPDLLRTYPEWRVSLYRELSRFAFASGHDYWGWRFAGWALHYIGDLTQPYHAHPLPGVGTLEALWLVARGQTADAVQLVSNRHGVLESYQYQRVQAALDAKAWDNPILVAIASAGVSDEAVPEFNESTLRDTLTAESVAAGEALDEALEQHMPARFVSDPAFEWTGSGEEGAIVDAVRDAGGDAAVRALDSAVAAQMQQFSRYARAWIDDALVAPRRAQTP